MPGSGGGVPPTRPVALTRVCSDPDNRVVREEQRFVPDGRRAAARRGRTGGPLLAGHSAAPPAH